MASSIPRTAVALLLLLARPAGAEPRFARLFAGRDGCFQLHDMKADKLLVRFNPRRCARRTSPCSTFKVPLALIAFDAGALKNERSGMKWDGRRTSRAVWNRDQTATTWMRSSVVWFSQRLTRRLGMKKMKAYLARLGFGNGDMSGGLTTAWLESSLKVSPDEELQLWRRLWRGELPVSRHAIDMTRRITLLGTSTSGWTLHGKTGSGRLPGKRKLSLGWFVGRIAHGDREYVFVTSYNDRVEPTDRRPAGWVARDLSVKILNELGLLGGIRFD